jgi:ABC-2 type transport system ATP-binding protein
VCIDAEDPGQLDALQGMDGVLNVSRNGRKLTEVQVDDVARVPDLIDALVAKGIRLTRVDPHEPTLEELYFAVRKERRELGVEEQP